jgi:hypothetical protein
LWYLEYGISFAPNAGVQNLPRGFQAALFHKAAQARALSADTDRREG